MGFNKLSIAVLYSNFGPVLVCEGLATMPWNNNWNNSLHCT